MINLLFPKPKYEKEYFWQFKEVIASSVTPEYNIRNTAILTIIKNMIIGGYTTTLTRMVMGEQVWTNTNYPKVIDLVIKRFKDEYAIVTKEDSLTNDDKYKFIDKLLNILEMTAPRYLSLLDSYSAAEEHLLDPVGIKSTGITRFNDTPQDEGDFANDEHTTNLTQFDNSTENDLDTKMGRIKEINDNYRNILLDWSNEFHSLFIEEVNIK